MSENNANAVRIITHNALKNAGIDNAAQDAWFLFHHATGLDRLDMLKAPNQKLDAAIAAKLSQMTAERIKGKSVGRIIGKRDFDDLELFINAETLEPRDDTGALIEALMPHIHHHAQQNRSITVLDIGTGTGLIALSFLKFSDKVMAVGSDISAKALEAAQFNAKRNGLDARFTPLLSDGFESVKGPFDFIVSNPPYIRSDVIETLSVEVRAHDPHIALDGGDDGLDFYRMIAKNARAYLKPGGLIGVEIGFDQKQDVIALFKDQQWQLVSAHRDLGGNDRAILFKAQNTHT